MLLLFSASGSDMQQSRERANEMLQLLKKAKNLSTQKCYDAEEARQKGKTKRLGVTFNKIDAGFNI